MRAQIHAAIALDRFEQGELDLVAEAQFDLLARERKRFGQTRPGREHFGMRHLVHRSLPIRPLSPSGSFSDVKIEQACALVQTTRINSAQKKDALWCHGMAQSQLIRGRRNPRAVPDFNGCAVDIAVA
jgi:hypothetical protein